MSRQKQAWDIANKAYSAINDVLRDEDVGVGIAVCQLLSGWLKASSDAQITIGKGYLADVSYFNFTEGEE